MFPFMRAGKKSVHVWKSLKQQACHAGYKSIVVKKSVR
jgi:hypothetical protein